MYCSALSNQREDSAGERCAKLTWRHHALKTNKENLTRNKKNRNIDRKPKRLVTMQYDASFLLYQLRYSADYEDWATVENATKPANNIPFCIAVQLQ